MKCESRFRAVHVAIGWNPWHNPRRMKPVRHPRANVPDRKLSVVYYQTSEQQVFDLAEAGVPEIPVLGFSKFQKAPRSTEMHCHSGCLEIGVCLRGALTLLSNGGEHRIMPGDLYVNQPTDRHAIATCPKGTIVNSLLLRAPGADGFLRLDAREANALWIRLGNLPCHIATKTDPVRQAFAKLFRFQKEPPSPLRIAALVTTATSLLLDVAELLPNKGPQPHASTLERLMRQIRDNPERDFRVDDLARDSGLSASLLIAEFRQASGLPPHQFQLSCKLEKARRLLEETSDAITAIAFSLGFCSSQHFAGHFKRSYGMPPSQWRARAGASAAASKA